MFALIFFGQAAKPNAIDWQNINNFSSQVVHLFETLKKKRKIDEAEQDEDDTSPPTKKRKIDAAEQDEDDTSTIVEQKMMIEASKQLDKRNEEKLSLEIQQTYTYHGCTISEPAVGYTRFSNNITNENFQIFSDHFFAQMSRQLKIHPPDNIFDTNYDSNDDIDSNYDSEDYAGIVLASNSDYSGQSQSGQSFKIFTDKNVNVFQPYVDVCGICGNCFYCDLYKSFSTINAERLSLLDCAPIECPLISILDKYKEIQDSDFNQIVVEQYHLDTDCINIISNFLYQHDYIVQIKQQLKLKKNV